MSAAAAAKWAEAKDALERASATLDEAMQAHKLAAQEERAAWAVLEGLANGVKPKAWDRAPGAQG
jgi:hypothetical protein